MATSKKSSASVALDSDWQTEDDLRTLIRAKEIEKDPKRMEKVRALAQKKMLETASVASDTDD